MGNSGVSILSPANPSPRSRRCRWRRARSPLLLTYPVSIRNRTKKNRQQVRHKRPPRRVVKQTSVLFLIARPRHPGEYSVCSVRPWCSCGRGTRSARVVSKHPKCLFAPAQQGAHQNTINTSHLCHFSELEACKVSGRDRLDPSLQAV